MKLSKKKKKRYLRSAVSMGLISLSTMTTFMTPIMSLTSNAYADENKTAVVSQKKSTKTTTSEKQSQTPYRNVMYYGNWSIWGGQGNQYPKDLPTDTYTHLNFAFLDFDSNGELLTTDGEADLSTAFSDNAIGYGSANAGVISALEALRAKNPNMKLGVSLGGWSKSGDFSAVAADPAKRAHFVENVMKFIKFTGMDFVDVDWEYPTNVRQGDKVDNQGDEGTPNAKPEDRDNYIQLMQDLRDGLNKLGKETDKTYELSTALPADDKKLDAGIDVERLFNIIDFGNMMTYDLHGAWEDRSGHQTALYDNPDATDPTGATEGRYSVDRTVKYLEKHNVDMSKVVIGVANYTRGWAEVEKGTDESHPGLFQKASTELQDASGEATYGAMSEDSSLPGGSGRRGGIWSYRSIDQLKANDPSLKEYWDDKAKAPYLYSEKTKEFYTFDNVRSVEEKAKYVKEHHLGGMISWMSSQDKDGDGDGQRDELTNVIKNELFGTNKLPSIAEENEAALNVKLDLSLADGYSSDKQYALTIQNNEKVTESGFLGDINTKYSTIKKPTVVITMKDGSTLKQGAMNGTNIVSEKDGKTYVDLSSIWGMDFIKPGESAVLKLATKNGEAVDLNNIEKVELEQYYVSSVGKVKLSSQVIYGEDSPEANQKPTIEGVKDFHINTGNTFTKEMALEGVSAKDKEDGDLTKQIEVSGVEKVDTDNAGTYNLTYSVRDSEGQETTVAAKVIVAEEKAPTFKGLDTMKVFENDPELTKEEKLKGVQAFDSENNEITNIEVNGEVDMTKAGEYKLTYKAVSKTGKVGTAERTVEVVKEEAPRFEGTEDKSIKVGTTFDAKAGVTAIDGRGNVLSGDKITVSGNVDTTKAGEYKLTYTATSESGVKATTDRMITVEEKAVDPADEMINPKADVMVGYWHNWASKNDGYKQGTALSMELDEIDKAYNVIDVSFMKASENSHIPTFKPYNQTDEEFRQQIGKLNEEGRSVLLALGGADAHIELTQADKDAFVAEIIKQVDKYGFDGLDIDLEQSAITAAENQKVIPEALKEVKAHYAKEGKNFLITMAPEFPYLKASGAYAAYINGLDDQYDWINPQYYNQGGDGVSGENGQWLAQNNDNKKEDFLYYLSSALINGTDGSSQYVQIPANKLVIGLPSNPDAAGSGYVQDPSAVSKAMERLTNDDHAIKGLMTWSVNWDNGLDSSGKQYNWEFVNRYKDLIDYEGDGKTEENKKPILSGIADVTLTVGDAFDIMDGVKATDSEDGDLTSHIKVEGTVNTEKAGEYKLTYSVEDKEGQKVSKERTVKVQEEQAPTFKGVQDVTLTVGESFDAKAGVTATDAKGTDVTGSIQVEGTVNTEKAGTYKLIYNVKSASGKAEATATRQVIVKEETGTPAPEGNEWDANKVYLGGELVIYNGKQYQAKWWTQGDRPDQSGANGPWTEILDPNDPASKEWSANRVYVGGDEVTYNGETYRAKWWTSGDVPGKSDVWEKR